MSFWKRTPKPSLEPKSVTGSGGSGAVRIGALVQTPLPHVGASLFIDGPIKPKLRGAMNDLVLDLGDDASITFIPRDRTWRASLANLSAVLKRGADDWEAMQARLR